MAKKYLAYVRKSSEETEKQALSIEAQVAEIKRQFKDLDIKFLTDKDGNIGESMSAAKPGRPLFNKMIKLLESGKYAGVIAWHPDRLSRNMPDAARIVWDIQQGVIRDLKFCNFTFEKTPEGIMMLQMIMSQAQYFSAKLSKDVKRGNKKKRELGQLTGLAPAGYLTKSPTNNGRNTYVVPDPKRFSIIQKAFKMYLSGAYSVPEVVKWLNEDCGYLSIKRTKTGGKPMAVSTFYKMLANPRYAGLIQDPEHPRDPIHYIKAKYQPMISEEDYNTIQKLLGKKGGPRLPKEKIFTYKGLMTCGQCGCCLTAEEKYTKGRHYIYYHCTHKNKKIPCKQSCIEESLLEEELIGLLRKYTIGNELYEWGLKALDELANKEIAEHKLAETLQNNNIVELKKQLERLFGYMDRGVIPEEEYRLKSTEIRDKLCKAHEIQAEQARKADSWKDIVESTLRYLCNAEYVFKDAEKAAKLMILNSIGSKPQLTDKKVIITPHYWVKPIADFVKERTGNVNSVRNSDLQIKNSPKRAEFEKWCE